jgi:hypothetical protein
MEGTPAQRPAWIHGSNQGRVDITVRSPGETSCGSGIEKGKAQIAHGFPVSLAQEQCDNEGGYRAEEAQAAKPGKA